MRHFWVSLGALLIVAAPVAAREIVVSATDGKPVRPGDTAADAVPDTLAVLAITRGGVRTIGSVAVPASMTGPPESVKLSPDGRFAVVTSAQQPNTAPTPLLVPGDAVSVVDLSDPTAPRVVQRTAAGAGAAGVAFNRAGTMVLVANGAADSVSAYAFARGRLRAVGTVALPVGSKPVALRFARDGRSALVVGAGAGRLFRLSVAGPRVSATGESVATGRSPSALTLSRDGRIAYVANIGGDIGGNRPATDPARAVGTVAAVDVARLRVLGTADLGVLPELIALSPSGRYLEATVVDGSHLAPGAPGYRAQGVLRVFGVAGARVTPLAEIATSPLCQGAAWSRDERRILLQCAGTRTVEVYRFDGRTLTRDAAPLSFAGRPGAMAGRYSR